MSIKDIIDISRHRGYFIDQSQSLNLFMENANYSKLTSMHFYGWKSGLKTGMYYLRTKSAVNAIKFTLKKEDKKKPVAALTEPVEGIPSPSPAAQVKTDPSSTSLSPEELRALIAQSTV